MDDTRILGIETSCDETAAAVVAGGRRVHSSVVASQIALHAAHGGVVPELASRAHVEKIAIVIREALAQAGTGLDRIDAVAVTYAPGLIGALLVGVEAAKGIALASGKPFVAAHHIRAHLYSPFLEDAQGRPMRAALTPDDAGEWDYPYVGLAVSGGHSSLALVESPLRMRAIGETRDDAAGEAYDKVAKLLGLGYPGGPVIDRLAGEGDAARFDLPRPMMQSGDLDFSFSGLKTAVRLIVERQAPPGDAPTRPDVLPDTARGRFVRDMCAAFQAAVVETALAKAARAARAHGVRRVALVGGVACNRELRRQAAGLAREGLSVVAPLPSLCGDNAAMIAGLGYHHYVAGERADLSLNPRATVEI